MSESIQTGRSFERIGEFGNAAKTVAGKVSAMNHFESFLKLKNMGPFQSLNEKQLCDIPLLQEFGTYLCDEARDNRTKDLLSKGTAQQYLSGVKITLSEKFRDNEIWKDVDDWYTSLREAVGNRVIIRCIEKGVPISEKSKPVGRVLLKEINEHLLLSDSKSAYEKRAILSITFAAVGRAGEIANTTWNSATWDRDVECLCLDWTEKKTSRVKLMTFFPDSKYFELDVYHSLACYLIAGGTAAYSEDSENWIFPKLAGLSQPSNHVSKILKDIESTKKVKGLFEDVSGTCLRVGATNQMANHPRVELTHVIQRGGWDFSGISNIYIFCT
jgi:hypothetical protein